MTPAAAVYRAYDARGRLLYVGLTTCVKERMKAHQRRSPWHAALAALDVTEYANYGEAWAAETDAIRTEWPLWNVKGSPWRDRTAV